MSSRREFMFTLGALAAGTLAARRSAVARFLEPSFNFTSKALPGNRGMVIGTLTNGGNVLLVKTDTGPIIVDAKFAHSGPDLFADIKAHAGAAPAMLINTHHHADHSGGNWIFHENGVTIAAHQNFNQRIKDTRGRYIKGAEDYVTELQQSGAAPDKIKNAQANFEKIKQLKTASYAATQTLPSTVNLLNIGGVDLQAYHYGNGHTDNDLVVFFPKQNVLHMGDLVFNRLHPFIDRPAKAHTLDWQGALRQASKLGDAETIVIPGHGEVTDKTAITRQIEYFDQLRAIVKTARKEKKPREEVVAMKPEQFKDIGFENLLPMALGAMYDELKDNWQ